MSITEEATFDQETGEIKEPVSLSQQAARGVRRPQYWRKAEGSPSGNIAGDEFAYAFLSVQEQLSPLIEGDKENPFTKSKYTTLGALLKLVRPILNQYFITLEQYCGDVVSTVDKPGANHWILPVFTRLEHVPSMQQKIYKFPSAVVAWNPQGQASAFTYGKRYSLLGALGMATGEDDDDGNKATIIKGIDGKLSEFAENLAGTMKTFKSARDLKQWASQNASGFDILEESDRQKLRVVYDDLLKELAQPEGGKAKK
jgi:hypothetical protein